MSTDQPRRDLDGSDHDDDLFAQVAANPELARVAFLLAAAPSDRELAGLDGAIREFRAHVSTPSTNRRRRSMISTLAGAKLGATIAGIAVGLGGAATVAYVSASAPASPDKADTVATSAALPSQAAAGQDQAADAKDKSADAKAGAPVGPDASGSAAYGLCTAWKNIANQDKAKESVAFQNLVKAAGGEDKVDAYCAKVEAPGKSGEHATGKPDDAPGKPATVTTGKPSDAPTGKPETVPTPTEPGTRPTTPTAPTSHPTGRS